MTHCNDTMDERIAQFKNDPQKMELANKFVSEVIERAKDEAAKRSHSREMMEEEEKQHYLPLEVLENIMKFITCLEDRKSAALVNRDWYQAFLNKKLRNLEIVKLRSEGDFNLFQQQPIGSLTYVHYEFEQVDITRASRLFWYNRGPYIKSLTLRRCYVGERIFAEALSRCTNLEALTIEECKDLFMSGIFLESLKTNNQLRCSMRQVRTLDFRHNRYLSDAVLYTVLMMCPFVHTLNLTGCNISYHNGMYKKFYPQDSQPPSESVTTFHTLFRLFEGRGRMLRSLSFEETLMDNASLLRIAHSPHMRLSTLKIRGCPQLTDNGVIESCSTSHFQSLTELDIGNCERLTDLALIEICSNIGNLKRLSIQGCKTITDHGVSSLYHLNKLQTLKAGECSSVQGDGLLRGIANKQNSNMRELSLTQMVNLSEAILKEILMHLPELHNLDLSGCHLAVTDTSLHVIFQRVTKLRTLNLAHCEAITDGGLTGLAVPEFPKNNRDAQLLRIPLGSRHELDIRMDAEIKEQVKELCERAVVSQTDDSRESLSSLRELRHLILTGCTRVTDVSLQHAFSFTGLQSLDMTQCQQISQMGLVNLVENCRSLVELNFNMCHNLNDEAVKVLVQGLPRLKKLCLGSDLITDNMVHILEKSMVAHLDVRHCSKVTASEISQLKSKLTSLKTLKYHEPPLPVIVEAQVKPPKPPAPFQLWKWCSR